MLLAVRTNRVMMHEEVWRAREKLELRLEQLLRFVYRNLISTRAT